MSNNPQFVAIGFRQTDILMALDGSAEAQDSGENNEEDFISKDDCDTEDDVEGTFSSGSD